MLSFVNEPTTILIPHIIALCALVIGSYTDLRTREVPDWINLGLIGVGIAINLMFSLIFWDYSFVLASVVGLAIFFAFGWLMFYTGQWGGGDSKMLMGLAALLGIDVFAKEFPYIAHFLINIIIVGALYGVFWTLYLIAKHRKLFLTQFKKQYRSDFVKKIRLIIFVLFGIIVISALIIPDPYLKGVFFYIALILTFTFYIWIAVKAVEKSCMIKKVTPDKVTEGDWIAKEITVDKKYIAGPKDLGIEKKQMKKLMQLYKKKKIKYVMVKEGIPFIPSFLLAYIATLLFGNIIFAIL